MARRGRKTLVAGYKRGLQRLGNSDIDGIVGAETFPQIPNA